MGNKINISLWANDKKSDKQPDYRSSFKGEDGQWVSVMGGWFKSTPKGTDYISLSIDLDGLKKYIEFENKRKQAAPAQQEIAPKPEAKKATEADSVINPDDLPF